MMRIQILFLSFILISLIVFTDGLSLPLNSTIIRQTRITSWLQRWNLNRFQELLPSFPDLMSLISSVIGPIGLSTYSLETIVPAVVKPSYDFIVIGGGTAGSVLANRLSEDGKSRVLLIEAGSKEPDINSIPFVHQFLRKTDTDWSYQSTPQVKSGLGLKGHRIPIPRGKMIGGCSSQGSMIYSRGSPKDYDRWKSLGVNGWSFPDVFPYFAKAEGAASLWDFEPGYHGLTGPYKVTQYSSPLNVETALLGAVREAGWFVSDYNGKNQTTFAFSQFNIDEGSRVSTGKAYLSDASSRPNLDIVLDSKVTRILFDEKKVANGVEFISSKIGYTVTATKEIILSAGAINSPQILMLSGIGPKDHLESHGIKVLVDAPGVGSNLQDHPMTMIPFLTEKGSSFVYNRVFELFNSLYKYVTERKGIIASPGPNIVGFYRTKFADDRPDIEFQIEGTAFGGSLPTSFLGTIFNFRSELVERYLAPNGRSDGFTIYPILLRPKSRGTVRLFSNSPNDAPLIDFNLLDNERDIERLIEGCKQAIRIGSMPSLIRINSRRFPGSPGLCGQYEFITDAYLKCYVQTLITTNNHPAGTVRMGSQEDKMSPLDNKLKVKGVDKLRVVDASVFPEIVSGNLNAPVIMIAEKAADLILGKPKLKPSQPPIQL